MRTKRELLTTANEVLTIQDDVIAIWGMTHQELSLRRKHQLQSMLPKESASICTNDSLSPDKLFRRLPRKGFEICEGIIQTHKQKSFWPTVPAVSETTTGRQIFLRPTTPLQPQGWLRSEQGKGREAVFEPARVSQKVTTGSAATVPRGQISDKGRQENFMKALITLEPG